MGPLTGITVIEMAAIGPVPFAGMLLSDLGADVIRVERSVNTVLPPKQDILSRGKRSIGINLKSSEGVALFRQLCGGADILIEGFRPGVMEKLGLGPETLTADNARLVFGRMTGWGQTGPLAQAAGHDINYIALTGALHAIGEQDGRPVPPLNLLGDYGGGALYLVIGCLAALVEARQSGCGQVIDAAMVDGSASLMSVFYALNAMGRWQDERGVNKLDGGAHFYSTYKTSDNKYVSIGPLEPVFYGQLLDKLALAGHPLLQRQLDSETWQQAQQVFADKFAEHPQSYWCELLEGTDVCFAPVLNMSEAPHHSHNQARGVFTEAFGVVQPAPAPRFSRTASEIQGAPPIPGEHTREILQDSGLPEEQITLLLEKQVIF